jgi:hypothetical protein
MATRCCWPPESWLLFGDANLQQQVAGSLLCLRRTPFANYPLRQDDVPQSGQVWEEIKELKDHAHFGPHLVDILGPVQGDAIYDDAPAVNRFQVIDAA